MPSITSSITSSKKSSPKKSPKKPWMGGHPPSNSNIFKRGINSALYRLKINAVLTGGKTKRRRNNKSDKLYRWRFPPFSMQKLVNCIII